MNLKSPKDRDELVRWPAVPGHTGEPVWTGDGFDVDGERLAILQYSLRPTGWDDEMANLVEHEVDEHKPIGKASRSYVLDELTSRLGGIERPAILEVGCSTGFLLRELAAAMPKARLVGAEYAYPALEALTGRLPGIPLVQMDITCSPLPAAWFDGIAASNVLEHIEDDTAAMRHMFRMLKPGGVAVIEVPAGPGLYDGFDRHVGHYRRYRMSELRRKLREAGFDILSASHLGFFAYPVFWLAKKRNRLTDKGAGEGQALTLRTLRAGRRSVVLQASFELERALRRYAYLPFGIRCLAVAGKPR